MDIKHPMEENNPPIKRSFMRPLIGIVLCFVEAFSGVFSGVIAKKLKNINLVTILTVRSFGICFLALPVVIFRYGTHL